MLGSTVAPNHNAAFGRRHAVRTTFLASHAAGDHGCPWNRDGTAQQVPTGHQRNHLRVRLCLRDCCLPTQPAASHGNRGPARVSAPALWMDRYLQRACSVRFHRLHSRHACIRSGCRDRPIKRSKHAQCGVANLFTDRVGTLDWPVDDPRGSQANDRLPATGGPGLCPRITRPPHAVPGVKAGPAFVVSWPLAQHKVSRQRLLTTVPERQRRRLKNHH